MKRLLPFYIAIGIAGTALSAMADDNVLALQHALDNAGYDVNGQDGQWGPGMRSAMEAFAADHGLTLEIPQSSPDAAAVEALLAVTNAAIDAAYAAYPTQPLPQKYFVGLGSHWYFNIHNWMEQQGALTLQDGKFVKVPVKRFHEPIEPDIEKFHAAGVPVVRAMLGMDGALFYDKCDYQKTGDQAIFDACYVKSYAEAKADGWAEQSARLARFENNPVVKLYVDSVEYWTTRGFHVIVVPNDFFNGTGSHFDGSDAKHGHPLFHAALEKDKAFQEFYPRFVGAVIGELKRRKLTNFSLQSASEPKFCGGDDNRPIAGGLAKWEAIESAVFHAARRLAPRLSLVSSALCTNGHEYFLSGRPYSEVGRILADHSELDDVTYALHLYTPRALMFAQAQNARYEAGTVIHYPYQRIPAPAALNNEAEEAIVLYNRQKPDAAMFEKMFADLADYAAAKSARIMFTEFNAPKPNFGLPREDRIALIRDLVASSREHDIPIVHFATVDPWGLSSCPHSDFVPDHRFDPALLNLIAWGNSVAGADPDAPAEPTEVQCGAPAEFTTEEVENAGGSTAQVEAILPTSREGRRAIMYDMRGFYLQSREEFADLSITLVDPRPRDPLPEALEACRGNLIPEDGTYLVKFRVARRNGALRARFMTCVLDNAPENVAEALHLLTHQLPKIAADMVASGGVDRLGSPHLAEWIRAVAAGDVVILPPDD